MDAIDWAYLLALGIILIGIEALLFSFVLLWIGIGFIVVAILSYGDMFDSGYVQIAVAVSIGLLLVLVLRKWSMNLINKSEDDTEEKIHKSGIGIIDGGMIKMNGTYWQSDEDLSGFNDGDRVEVVDIVNNKAKLAN
jgi:membrane protein implicated in regulation of membrane protease activity